MKRLEFTSQLQSYVRELSVLPPVDWEKVVVYVEYQIDQDGCLINESMAEYWANGVRFADLPSSYAAMHSRLDYFMACAESGDHWTGMRLKVCADGTYQAIYYRDSTPLLDGDYEEAESRLSKDVVA